MKASVFEFVEGEKQPKLTKKMQFLLQVSQLHSICRFAVMQSESLASILSSVHLRSNTCALAGVRRLRERAHDESGGSPSQGMKEERENSSTWRRRSRSRRPPSATPVLLGCSAKPTCHMLLPSSSELQGDGRGSCLERMKVKASWHVKSRA